MKLTPVCSPDYETDNFKLVDKIARREKGKYHNQPRTDYREILADAKYALYDNSCNDVQEIDGAQLFFYMQLVFKTTFIPWVLARCTIIPL